MLLEQINKTGDIKNISKSDYPELAQEIREYLINKIINEAKPDIDKNNKGEFLKKLIISLIHRTR